MKVIIETPRTRDWKEVNQLAKQVHEFHVKLRPDLFLEVDEVISKENFNKMIEEKEIFIAKIENKIMGYVTIKIKEKINPIMQYKKWLVIDAICINKEDRGKGIGTVLLNYVKKIGKEKKCTDIYLTVNEENKNAIRFYEKFGLRVKNISYSMPI